MKTQQKRSEALLEYPPFILTRRSIASESHPERNEDSLIAKMIIPSDTRNIIFYLKIIF